MKFEFIEGKHGTQLIITPETVEETGRLLRTSQNAKVQPVSIHYTFAAGDGEKPQDPHCAIWIGKVEPQKQQNSVSNKRRGK